MKEYLPEAMAIVLVIGVIALFAWQLLGAKVSGGGWDGHISRCLSALGPNYDPHYSATCETATAEASVTPAWWQFWWHPVKVSATPASWQFWLHPAPTTFFSVVTPVPTAAP